MGTKAAGDNVTNDPIVTGLYNEACLGADQIMPSIKPLHSAPSFSRALCRGMSLHQLPLSCNLYFLSPKRWASHEGGKNEAVKGWSLMTFWSLLQYFRDDFSGRWLFHGFNLPVSHVYHNRITDQRKVQKLGPATPALT